MRDLGEGMTALWTERGRGISVPHEMELVGRKDMACSLTGNARPKD